MKKKILFVASMLAVASLSVGTTLAYLQSETETLINTMEVGEVDIEQLEYERVVENGSWVSMGEEDKYGYTPDKLQEFTQNKPLLPAVFADGDIKWDDRNGSSAEDGTGHQQSWIQVGSSGSNQLFDDSVKNVIDKFVFVKNTGTTDAYVRTWFAFEQGSIAGENFKNVVMTNSNQAQWSWETVATDVEITDENGVSNEYVIKVATYLGPKSNPTGVLSANKVSYPSLLQLYMRPEATNEDVKALDGNGNGTYDVLVVSQAMQVAGFEDAKTALDTAFGEVKVENHPFK